MPEGFYSIKPEELAALSIRNPHIQIVDVRFPNAFERWRIPQSTNLPLYRATPEALAQKIQPTEILYVICKNGSVGQRIVETYGDLFRKQHREVVFVEGGLKAWENAGLPTFRKVSQWEYPEFQCGVIVWSLILLFTALAAIFHRGFLGVAALIMAGVVYFSTLSSATPFTQLLRKMPWNRRGFPSSIRADQSVENPSSQQAPPHEITKD